MSRIPGAGELRRKLEWVEHFDFGLSTLIGPDDLLDCYSARIPGNFVIVGLPPEAA